MYCQIVLFVYLALVGQCLRFKTYEKKLNNLVLWRYILVHEVNRSGRMNCT